MKHKKKRKEKTVKFCFKTITKMMIYCYELWWAHEKPTGWRKFQMTTISYNKMVYHGEKKYSQLYAITCDWGRT